jgi:hypothetical protein
MTSPSGTRLQGDDYQHLFSWLFMLELLMPERKADRVTIEDASAGSFDDVTVRRDANSSLPDEFNQIKYHVDHRSEYSSSSLMDQEPNHASLLAKFWRSWQTLVSQQGAKRPIELSLLTNWTWDSTDPFKTCIDGHDNKIKNGFLTAFNRSRIGKIRESWKATLGAGEPEFGSFISCLRLRVGFASSKELEGRVAERMSFLGLKSDPSALLISAGIVRNWIKSGRHEVSRTDIEETLQRHDLYLPKSAERAITVYLTTVKDRQFDLAPDFILDWRDYFVGDAAKKGHRLIPGMEWNLDLLPQLQQLEARINRETDCRLIRARGLARLSAWFAFGFSFSEVNRYQIEIDQYGELWRTDSTPSPDFRLLTNSESDPSAGEQLGGKEKVSAVGVSLTGSLEQDVRNYLADAGNPASALLLIRPELGISRTCLRDAADLVALADGAKRLMADFVKRTKAERLLLFYYGPLSGACFIGHRLNAICKEIQIMEDQQPGYAPSCLLT